MSEPTPGPSLEHVRRLFEETAGDEKHDPSARSVLARGDIPATVGGLVVLAAYWVAKSQRLVHTKGERDVGAETGRAVGP